MRTGGRVAQARRVEQLEVVAGRDSDEDAVGLELREFILEVRPGWKRAGIPLKAKRDVHHGNWVFVRVAVLVNPLQRIFNPVEPAFAVVIEDAQAHEIDARRYAVIRGARAVGADNTGYVRAMAALSAVVIRIPVVLFGEIPATDDAEIRAQSVTQRRMIPSDTAVDDRHRRSE